MAGADKEEFPPLLPVGFHPMTVAGVRRLCVDRFPHSVTRPGVMENLSSLVDLINQRSFAAELWINGSFTTQKLNPDDVDLVLVIKAKVFLKLDGAQRSFCDWFRTSSLYERYKCDNYFLIEEDGRPEGEWFYAYWLRQFGFSRADEMKGLAVVKVPFLVMP